MAQHDYVIANGTGAAVRSDLNNALAAIVSQNSGATEPATTYAYQFWADTTTGTLKLRNSANSAWIELLQLDGTLTMEDGTEALPGLSFRNDLDTGLWRPGANQLAISTNAVERVEFGASEVVFNDGGANYDFRVEGDTNANLLFVDASADAVGIGTSSPGAKLSIQDGTTVDVSGSAIRMELSGSNPYWEIQGLNGVNSAGRKLNFYTSSLGGVNVLTLLQSGNVGIGTASPGDQLALLSNTNSANGITVENTNTSSDARGQLQIKSDSVTGYLWAGSSTFVGTAGGGRASTLALTTSSTDTAGGIALLARNSSAPITFHTGGNTERARIDSSGRLLVGTSTSFDEGNQLQVNGTLAASFYRFGADDGQVSIGSARGTVASPTTLSSTDIIGNISFRGHDGSSFKTGARIRAEIDGITPSSDLPTRLTFSTTADGASSPTERMRIAQDGRITTKGGGTGATVAFNVTNSADTALFNVRNDGLIGTGTTTNSPYNFTTASAANMFVDSGGLVYRSTSSLKYKKNVADAQFGLQELLALRPVTYQSKTEADGETVYGGLIAEEVDAAGLQEFVQYADDGTPDALAYGNMVALCIKAIQEQQAVITELQTKVAALESA